MTEAPTVTTPPTRVLRADVALWRRRELGIPQRAVADRMGMSEAQLSRVLTGQRGTTFVELDALARALELPVDVLAPIVELAHDMPPAA